jgi:hypothetical protein
MLIAILAVLALAWWLNREGLLIPNLLRLGGTAAAALLAVRFLSSGRLLLALVAAAAGAAWWIWHKRVPQGRPTELTRAARLLNVPANAPSETIWQAWRSAMTTAHPDAGGSDAAAQALTAARDLLIAAAEKRRDTER